MVEQPHDSDNDNDDDILDGPRLVEQPHDNDDDDDDDNNDDDNLDGPRLVEQPATVSGDLGDSVTLRCRVDSNPPATYTWTRGTSRQVRG